MSKQTKSPMTVFDVTIKLFLHFILVEFWKSGRSTSLKKSSVSRITQFPSEINILNQGSWCLLVHQPNCTLTSSELPMPQLCFPFSKMHVCFTNPDRD